MIRVLVSWIGQTDLNAAGGDAVAARGPIGQAVSERTFDQVVLLSNYAVEKAEVFAAWIARQTSASVTMRFVPLTSPTNFPQIYQAALEACRFARSQFGKDVRFTFHISPGTPPMAVVWIVLARTAFEGELIESSRQAGVKTVEFPFEISAEFLPALTRRTSRELDRVASGELPEAPEFKEIVHRSEEMKRLIERACVAAPFPHPILLLGESGTGKELIAAATHRASLRTGHFETVNCGAIPREIAESQLFGHEKGAFTGADRAHSGHFESVAGGTLFLDEIGDLAPELQVKLLRVLQEKKVRRVGGQREIPVDFRLICATNRDLAQDVVAGRFREDLFFRLAVLVLKIPPLRNRQGDIGLLADTFLEKSNLEARNIPGLLQKNFSPAARSLLLRHNWPGNVRELEATILRASIWSKGEVIDAQDVQDAMATHPGSDAERVLGQPFAEGFDVREVMARVARHYLERALEEGKGKKTEAARLLGLNNYQTVTDWMKKYGMEE